MALIIPLVAARGRHFRGWPWPWRPDALPPGCQGFQCVGAPTPSPVASTPAVPSPTVAAAPPAPTVAEVSSVETNKPMAAPTPGAATADDDSGYAWTLIENNGNAMPRHEGGLALCGGNLYLMGGREERTTDIFSLETYEYVEQNGPNFTDISHFNAVTVGNEIWFFPFAGTYDPGEYPSDVYFRYNCEDDVLLEVPWDPFYARGSAAATYADGYVYLIGGGVNGHYGPPISNVSRISVESGEWEELAPNIIPRDHAGAALVEDEIYLCGGRQTDRPYPQEDLIDGCEIYNISGNYWRTLVTTNNLTQRAGVGMVNWEGIPIIMGGETPDYALTTVEALDVATSTWFTLPDMVLSRHGFGAVVTEDNRIWVCGGNEIVGGGDELASCEVFPSDPRQESTAI
ncbi:hypothetical protein CTAYLR_007402 [Chrysophaeum taylorii]|uniref:Kelch repeat-containing protein n=1 Tax=Chrysophaeum taylorii TaxID=2483200 RepID=A0AAD7XG84_9STRA|nr:hypothetical protein CTAYLR_007402 [Chrysophaeum taylorii]